MYIYIYTYVETNIYYLCDGFLLALTLREHITREGVLREHITFVTASSLPLPLAGPKMPNGLNPNRPAHTHVVSVADRHT